jgi:uncharacterized protein
MTTVAAAALGLVVGLVIGGLGGGGGVLTVPVLVYLLGLAPHDAVAGSVVVVGVSAAVGVAVRLPARELEWRTGLALGAAGAPAAWAGSVLGQRVDRPVLLVTFAAVTVLAAVAMLITDAPDDDPPHDRAPAGRTATAVAVRPARARLVRAGTVVVGGAAVGFLTGFLGVGGGFLVLPLLVVALRTPVHRAVGTSLLVIVVNAATALASRAGDLALDWAVLLPFALASLAGTALGHRVAGRLPGAVLTRAFAVLLLVVGAVVGVDAFRTT